MTDPLPRTADGVVLRRLCAEDLCAFQAYRHDPKLARFQGWAPTADKDARDLLIHMSKTKLLRPGIWCQIGIADPSTSDLIGDIGLILASDSANAEIGFTLRRESQGRGLATAAVIEAIKMIFEHTRAETIFGISDTRNVSSIRLLERVGMCKVNTQNVTTRGKPRTQHVYAVSKHNDG